ncbi:MAG: VIT domain-containing protein, partial [Methylibium sp.]
MNKLASALTGLGGERVALCEVSVTADLQDLLAEVTVSQTYRNDERVNIEAVYTFPLPLDAVLLELEVEIGGRVLKGVVVEKKAAEEKYEDAVEAGDAAVMLEAIEPGLYTMNVGNLLPQETAKITFRYAILYRWAGDRLRFFLPTTIAPRFGESPHLPHQAPEASLTVENQFSLRVEVRGALRDAQFVCPSHAVELVKSPESVVLSLSQPKAVMDRDFVLNVKAPQATRSFVLCGQDGDGLAAVASFQPFFPGLQQPRPLNLAIVIDCSGSMQGDSMEQAKQALEGILDGLQPHDRIALIAFGNSTNA